MKKKLTALVILFVSQGLFAASAKETINYVLQDWIFPLCLLGFSLTFIIAFKNNFNLILDESNQGTFWKGMNNVSATVGYWFLGFSTIAVIIEIINLLKLF